MRNRFNPIVIALLVAAFLLRIHQLGGVHTIRDDEMSWILAGTSLWQTGTPASWTIPWKFYSWDLYDSVTYELKAGRQYALVTPWLDHPPAFFTPLGSWVHITQQASLEAPNWHILRFPMIAIALSTIALTYLLTKKVWGSTIALTALAAFSFFPANILASRFVVAENMIPLLEIVLLYILWLLHNTSTKKDARHNQKLYWLLTALCFVAPLIKLSGIVVPLSTFIFLLLEHKWRALKFAIGGLAAALLTFIGYAFFYDWDVFMAAQTAHSTRVQSLMHPWALFTDLTIGRLPLNDPALIAGLIGLVALLSIERRRIPQRLLFAAIAAHIVGLLLVAPVEMYDWYRFPFFPFLALGLGFLWWKFISGNTLTLLVYVPLLAAMLEKNNVVDDVTLLKGFVFIAAASLLWVFNTQKEFVVTRVALFALGILFLLQITWIIEFINQHIHAI